MRLRSSEWLLSGSLVLLLISLYAIAKIKVAYYAPQTHCIYVDVQIEGHVKQPGLYSVAQGTKIRDVVKQARPLKFADLKEVADQPVTQPITIQIRKLQEIVILTEGAIQNPGPLRVPVGTRISDLKKFLTLTPEADPKFFKKRRLLVDGEVIKITCRQ